MYILFIVRKVGCFNSLVIRRGGSSRLLAAIVNYYSIVQREQLQHLTFWEQRPLQSLRIERGSFLNLYKILKSSLLAKIKFRNLPSNQAASSSGNLLALEQAMKSSLSSLCSSSSTPVSIYKSLALFAIVFLSYQNFFYCSSYSAAIFFYRSASLEASAYFNSASFSFASRSSVSFLACSRASSFSVSLLFAQIESNLAWSASRCNLSASFFQSLALPLRRIFITALSAVYQASSLALSAASYFSLAILTKTSAYWCIFAFWAARVFSLAFASYNALCVASNYSYSFQARSEAA